MIKNMIQEIIDFLNTYIKAHGCTEMNKWVEFLEQLGWHPASELPNLGEEVVTWVNHGDGAITVSRGIYVGWPEEIINKLWWCYPPEKE